MSRKRKKRRKAQRKKQQNDPGQVELLPELAEAEEGEGAGAADADHGESDVESSDAADGESDAESGKRGGTADGESDGERGKRGDTAPGDPNAESGKSGDATEGKAPAGPDSAKAVESGEEGPVAAADKSADKASDESGRASDDEAKTQPSREAVQAPEDDGRPPAPRPAGNQLGLARDLVEAGRIPEAIALYQSILAERPDNLKAHNNLGVLLDGLGERARALEHFEAALEADAQNVEVLSNYGSTLTELARYDEADEVLRRAQRLAPDDLRTRLALGILAFRRGLYDLAETELHSVCDRDPEHGLAFYYRGEALNRAGRFDEAVEVMLRAAELLPSDPRPVYTLGHLYDRANQRMEAAEMYRRARDLQSDSTP